MVTVVLPATGTGKVIVEVPRVSVLVNVEVEVAVTVPTLVVEIVVAR